MSQTLVLLQRDLYAKFQPRGNCQVLESTATRLRRGYACGGTRLERYQAGITWSRNVQVLAAVKCVISCDRSGPGYSSMKATMREDRRNDGMRGPRPVILSCSSSIDDAGALSRTAVSCQHTARLGPSSSAFRVAGKGKIRGVQAIC